MENTILFLQVLLADTAGIPFSCIACNETALMTFFQSKELLFFNSFLAHNLTFWYRLLQPSAQPDTVYECTSPSGISLLFYASRQTDQIFLFGPVLTKPFSKEELLHTSVPGQLSVQAQEQFWEFHRALPFVESHVLCRAGELVIRHLTGRQKPMKIIQTDLTPVCRTYPLHSADTAGVDIAQMRQVEVRYESSATLTDAVRQGNLSLALHLMGQYDPNRQTAVRNANPLRNAQNYCIVLNTQLRHALEKSGIHPFRVDKLSNEIGLEIEQLKELAQLPGFFEQVVRRYCRLVQEHAYPDLKPLTNLAVTYIKEHLADNLTVRDTAKALTVNANYLSTLFHKDMKMTFIDFVNRERIDQAAALLQHTNLQIQQIASTVGYNNTSYFAKQFLRFQGMSPSHYRRDRSMQA